MSACKSSVMASGLKACVIGSGSNGLSAAIVLAQAGLQVEVLEAERIPGGATRSMELTLPGFIHDFGSAVFPLGAGSPFPRFRSTITAWNGYVLRFPLLILWMTGVQLF